MREIKFRAKQNKNGKWLYGGIAHLRDVPAIIVNYIEEDFGSYLDENYIIPETIGQYVGLVDIDGKEIYEGDIVQDMYMYKSHLELVKQGRETKKQAEIYIKSGEIGVVEFCKDGRLVNSEFDDKFFVGSGYKADNVDLTCCKIIGNIYENPELLKKESK